MYSIRVGGAKAYACLWHGFEVVVQRRLETYPCYAWMFCAQQRIMKALYARGIIPNAFGTSVMPEQWGLQINLVPVYDSQSVWRAGNRHTSGFLSVLYFFYYTLNGEIF
jgi:uncharacterized membrane protein